MAGASKPPFTISSIAFAFPGSRHVIPLRDPNTLGFLGDEPEWTAAGRRGVAAFVRGKRPVIRVVFARGDPSTPSGRTWRIKAKGQGGPGIATQSVKLEFDDRGLSGPHEMRLDATLPNEIGPVDVYWQWTAERAGARAQLSWTRHRFYLTWREPVSPSVWATRMEPKTGPAGEPDRTWVYLPIMQWTCEWAKGKSNPKLICDAILARLAESGLQYAPFVAAYSVQDMLTGAGGYCFGWYHMFQAMAGSQGVKVERRTYAPDWQNQARGEARWCAIVVESPGLNRTEPLEKPSRFNDVRRRPVSSSRLDVGQRHRYRFWGAPGICADGHCINFLKYRGRWFLYDASFRSEPVALKGFTLPRSDVLHAFPVGRLGNFKDSYLEGAVPFMLGSLVHRGRLVQTIHPETATGHTRNGITLKTDLIPRGDRDLRFFWTE